MSTTANRLHRNQEPEPVRPWFARLFRRPSREALAAEPSPYAKAGRMAAEGFASGIRQADELRAAREEAARWKRHADSFEKDLRETTNALADRTQERDDAYEECAQLLAWIAALHPATAVITPAYDGEDSQDLYVVAGGWQMRWTLAAEYAGLFRHVTPVDVTDVRTQWDGHGSMQRGERIRNHVRLLALAAIGDGSSTAVMTGSEVRSA
ncbi:hypothetical protein OHB41_21135 [Streptomyces sp. NBC_01571]|uniref:hypothetical protein n=1 Tax=Streptomyces sp. NBC_01571 TaxID=2975883 RepID=UPI00224CDB11|nr:hypothetical protein [Streptomyces sp. NBC_01571]MCX4575649.1 hypothetical protein [Streptomyces sp. NBC_01571]